MEVGKKSGTNSLLTNSLLLQLATIKQRMWAVLKSAHLVLLRNREEGQQAPLVSENMCMAGKNEDPSLFWPGILLSFHTHQFPGDRSLT